MGDPVDGLLQQWSRERPELDCAGLAIVVRILRLAKVLGRDTDQALAPLDLRLWEYDVLSTLRRQGPPYALPASELARSALLSSGATTTRIDRLVARGLVCREPDPADGRGVGVTLTPRGLALVDRALEARLRAANTQIADLSPGERQALAAGLRKLLGG